jgi:ribosomal protein L32
MCSTNKICFDTKKAAKKRARRRSGNVGIKLRVYKCNECGFWHLTSTNNSSPFRSNKNEKRGN